MIRPSVIIAFVVGLAVGAVVALYYYCPVLCRRGVRTGVSGFLSRLGLDPGLAQDIAGELPV